MAEIGLSNRGGGRDRRFEFSFIHYPDREGVVYGKGFCEWKQLYEFARCGEETSKSLRSGQRDGAYLRIVRAWRQQRRNLFLLDGTPLYQVNHAGGLFSAFNTDIIKNIDFYKSGFPARYGGRLSSVVDVRTNDGNMKEYRGSFTLGLLEGRIQFEGPIVKNRTSFNVALRRTWMDLFTAPALAIINSSRRNKQNLRYAFHDLNAKVTHIFSEKAVRISAFIREMTFSSSGIKNTCLTRNRPMWTSSVCNGETSPHPSTGNTFSRTRCLPILQGFIPIISRTSIT